MSEPELRSLVHKILISGAELMAKVKNGEISEHKFAIDTEEAERAFCSRLRPHLRSTERNDG
jgi:hypothetical protein